MNPPLSGAPVSGQQEACVFYVEALERLIDARVPFLVGGAYALEQYTGLARNTKDLDLFVHPRDSQRVLEIFAAAGHGTDLPFPHWLGKVKCGDDVIDIIFSSGNGFARVDDVWFEHSVPGTVLGFPVRLCPPEETLWSKAFIMERERYDGADIAHLLRATAPGLDWARLLARFGPYWRVLLSHLILFGFIYPSERWRIPERVMRQLLGRVAAELDQPVPDDRVCRGTLLSRAQYLVDVENWGYRDGRLSAPVTMTPDDVATWTAAIDDGGSPRLSERAAATSSPSDADRRGR
jgi:hypothetical protein